MALIKAILKWNIVFFFFNILNCWDILKCIKEGQKRFGIILKDLFVLQTIILSLHLSVINVLLYIFKPNAKFNIQEMKRMAIRSLCSQAVNKIISLNFY